MEALWLHLKVDSYIWPCCFYYFPTTISFPRTKYLSRLLAAGAGIKPTLLIYLRALWVRQLVVTVRSPAHRMQIGFWQLYLQNVLLDVNEDVVLPVEFKLEQNYPNPFNPSTIIKFGIPERSNVQITIYDLLGSEVTTLLNQELDKGWYNLTFNANGFSSGFYIYRMQAGNYISTRKMLMIK